MNKKGLTFSTEQITKAFSTTPLGIITRLMLSGDNIKFEPKTPRSELETSLGQLTEIEMLTYEARERLLEKYESLVNFLDEMAEKSEVEGETFDEKVFAENTKLLDLCGLEYRIVNNFLWTTVGHRLLSEDIAHGDLAVRENYELIQVPDGAEGELPFEVVFILDPDAVEFIDGIPCGHESSDPENTPNRSNLN